MCSLCGALGTGPAWEHAGVAGDHARWLLRREAVATAAELTRVLRASRVRVTAQSGSGFAVAFPTGRTELVAGLTQVWHLLDRSNTAIPDPLAA